MAPGPSDTPAAIIGLDFETRGADKLDKFLTEHQRGWNQIEGYTGRIARNVDMIGGRLATMVGVGAGIGYLVNDMMRLDEAATRASISVGAITGGRSGVTPYRDALLTSQRATGVAGGQLASGAIATVAATGGNYLASAQHFRAFTTLLGQYSKGYNIPADQLGGTLGTLLQAGGQNPGSARGVLGQLSAILAPQFSGQMGMALSTVGQVSMGAAAANPQMAGPGLTGRVAGLYNALAASSPVYRDPGVFSGGVSAVTGGLQSAYGNPRMEAFLKMSGVSYWDQRQGLEGPQGAATAKRIMSTLDRFYGNNSMLKDMALRTMFGLQGANLIEQLSAGGGAAQKSWQRGGATTYGQGQAYLGSMLPGRAAQGSSDPLSQLNRSRAGLEQGGAGLWDSLWSNPLTQFAVGHPVETLAGGLLGRSLLRRGGPAAFRFLSGRFGSAAMAGLEGGGTDLAAAAASVEAAAAGEGSGSLLGGIAGGTVGGVLAGAAGAYAGLMVFPDQAGYSHEGKGVRGKNRRNAGMFALGVAREAEKKFGPLWYKSPAGKKWAMQRLASKPHGKLYVPNDEARRALRRLGTYETDQFGKVTNEGGVGSMLGDLAGGLPGIGGLLGGIVHGGASAWKGLTGRDAGADLLSRLFGSGGKKGKGGKAPTDQFDDSVDKFTAAVNKLLAALGYPAGGAGGTKGASWGGGGLAGPGLGAPAMQSIQSAAPGVVLAAWANNGGSSGGGSGPNSQFAAYYGGGSGGSGSGGAPTATPASANTPSGGGGADAGRGKGQFVGVMTATAYGPPWNAMEGGSDTAAPGDPPMKAGVRRYIVACGQFPFGTRLYIWPNPYGYTGVFQVMDRGGAIGAMNIDFFIAEGRKAQNAWGRRRVKVWREAKTKGGKKGGSSGGGPSIGSAHAAGAGAGTGAAAGGGGSGGGSGATAADAWLGGAGLASPGGGDGGTTIHVNVDGRRLETQRALTRGNI